MSAPKKRTRKLAVPKAATGYAYVRKWADGAVGWCGVSHVFDDGDSRRHPTPPSDLWVSYARPGDRAYLCRVTLTPVLDAKGRPITKVKEEP